MPEKTTPAIQPPIGPKFAVKARKAAVATPIEALKAIAVRVLTDRLIGFTADSLADGEKRHISQAWNLASCYSSCRLCRAGLHNDRRSIVKRFSTHDSRVENSK